MPTAFAAVGQRWLRIGDDTARLAEIAGQIVHRVDGKCRRTGVGSPGRPAAESERPRRSGEILGERADARRVHVAALGNGVRRIRRQHLFPCSAIGAIVTAARDQLASERQRNQRLGSRSRR